jgi:hypothetical protein
MTRTADIPQALQSLRPGAQWVLRGDSLAGLEWLDHAQTQPTETEINAEIARLNAQYPLDACREAAKALLVDTDWSEIPSVSDPANTPHLLNKADFITYRNTVRALVITPVANPTFPTVPVGQWSK